MKRRHVLLSALALGLGLALAMPRPATAETTWRVQSLHPAGSVGYDIFTNYFVPLVERMSGGRLVIKPFAADTVVKNDEGLDAVSAGSFQAAQLSPAYWVGKEPAMVFIRNASAGFEEFWQYSAWLYEGGGLEVAQEVYAKQGVHLVGLTMRPGESLHFKGKIASLADFREAGPKVRTPAGITTDLFAAMGGSPLYMSSSEIYTALDKGVIDAAEWTGLSDNYGIGLHEVTDSFLYPSFHSPIGIDDFFVNQDTWDELPADLQAVVETAVRAWSFHQWKTLFLRDIEAKKKIEATGDVHVTWPQEDLRKIRGMAKDIWQEWADKSPLAEKVYNSQTSFMRKIGLLE